ncbi:putative helicase [Venturia nashicola]|nr:putative helicase [Venturia nashicola]
MAKKKKTAVNSARGYATSSTPSKPKPEVQKKPAADTPLVKDEKAPPVLTEDDAADLSAADAKIPYQQTPEELEEQLERDDLQMIVEKNAQKVRRDAHRLDTKVRTDCRVLRGQAQRITFNPWLPEELMQQVLELVQKETSESGSVAKQTSLSRSMSEDDTVMKCWTLFEALQDLGFPDDRIKLVIAKLLKNPPGVESASYLWGFRESLDMFAVELEEAQLPTYDGRKERASLDTGDDSVDDTDFETPIDSRPLTPDPTSKRGRASSPRKKETASQQVSAIDADLHVSDFESDVEPEELVPRYLTIKERIWKHRPDLVDVIKSSKKWKANQPKINIPPATPGLAKLTAKLQQIESDTLFDQWEADRLWNIKKIDLVRDAVVTRPIKSLRGGNGSSSESESRGQLNENEDASSDNSGPNSDDEDLLGGMFAVSMDAPPSQPHQPGSTADPAIQLRDFGKPAGMSARRILEEACKSRDSRTTLKYNLVPTAGYISRATIAVYWSVHQERISMQAVPQIRLQQAKSSKGPSFTSAMNFSMSGVATPDALQAEAYISTVALFYIFSSSSKEEKLYLRLPAAWRDLYLELAEHRKGEADADDRQRVKMIRTIIRDHNEEEEDDGVVLSAAFRSRNRDSPRPGSSRNISPSKEVLGSRSNELMGIWHRVRITNSYQRMLVTRMNLPMFGFRAATLDAIDRNQVVILCGETGCGKSTQLPSYVLEHQLSQGKECKIYCTEPRRISAISLAQRVSEELGESKGDVGTHRSLVGYAIRLESKVTPSTKLVYATVGVVLRMLESSRTLDDITHLLIDEVHERSIDTDFLLVILRSLMARRPELKVVLMSATVDASRFSKYLNNAPIINVPGRTFPVRTRYLEDAIELTNFAGGNNKERVQDDDNDGDGDIDGVTSGIPKQLQGYSPQTRKTLATYDEYGIDYELIVRLMEHVATDPDHVDFSKATLIFLPGIAEIRQLNDIILSSPIFNRDCWVIPLHSSIASEEQQLAFEIPPPGIRKVVIATNIAETGITIPDVTCVIDTGKHKEMRYDERRQLSRLIQSFISRANAKQRRGRAGRVQEGLCFHLFTKYRHDDLMAEQQTPEMLRLSLQDLIMRVKICGLGDIEKTLSQALDPPLAKNIRRAIDALIEVGALTATEELTPLGNQLAKLPLDANLGKLCLLSAIFGCVDVGLTIAAILSSKSPFITPFGDRQRADIARLAYAKADSDLLTAYNAYTAWRRISQTQGQSAFNYCRKNYLSQPNLQNIEDLKTQLLSSLADTGLIPNPRRSGGGNRPHGRTAFVEVPPECDIHSPNEIITTSVIAWAFYPKLLVRDGKGWRNVANSQHVTLHPTSVNKSNHHDLKYLSYYSMMQSGGSKFLNALSTTAAQELPLMLLAGDADFKLHAGVVTIDGNRLRFRVDGWKDMLVLRGLRRAMEEIVEVRLRDGRREVSLRLRRWMDIFVKMCTREV